MESQHIVSWWVRNWFWLALSTGLCSGMVLTPLWSNTPERSRWTPFSRQTKPGRSHVKKQVLKNNSNNKTYFMGRPANRMLILDSRPEWVPRLEAICLISHSEKFPILRSLKMNAYQQEWPQLRAEASRPWLLFLALMSLLKSSRQVT